VFSRSGKSAVASSEKRDEGGVLDVGKRDS
jgi:hypothetical protein